MTVLNCSDTSFRADHFKVPHQRIAVDICIGHIVYTIYAYNNIIESHLVREYTHDIESDYISGSKVPTTKRATHKVNTYGTDYTLITSDIPDSVYILLRELCGVVRDDKEVRDKFLMYMNGKPVYERPDGTKYYRNDFTVKELKRA